MSQGKTRQKKRAGRSAPPRDGFSLLLLKHGGFGVCLGLCSAGLLLLAGAVLCYALPNPHSLMVPVSIAILYLAALVSGFGAAAAHRTAPLLCGLISGGGMLLLFGIVSLLIPGEGGISSSLSFALRCLALPMACVGAYLAHRRGSRPRRRAVKRR
ncbi:MAG: hypothetical protein IJY47_07560 [Clostridia bacterium]|nr:hypothetical protein [Clostridia bacterium]